MSTSHKGYTDAIIDYFNDKHKITTLDKRDYSSLNRFKTDKSTAIPDFMDVKNVDKEDAEFLLNYLKQHCPDNLHDRQNEGPTLLAMCQAVIQYNMNISGYIVSRDRSDERISFDIIRFITTLDKDAYNYPFSLQAKAYIYWLTHEVLDAYDDPNDIAIQNVNNHNNDSNETDVQISLWWD